MKTTTKNIDEIIITDVKGLDPIRVFIDEKQTEEIDGTIGFQAYIVILCYGTSVNYFFSSMGCPMKEFFQNAETSYLVGKFEVNARISYCPSAYDVRINEDDKIIREPSESYIEMDKFQKNHLSRIIEAIKTAFKESEELK